MTSQILLHPTPISFVKTGGQSVIAMYGPVYGGVIANPMTPADQGVTTVEELYVDLINSATPYESATTFKIQPGGWFMLPTGQTTNVSINAATSGHKFSAVIYQPMVPLVPPVGPFPPSGPTTLTQAIPSYLYQEYSDDDTLQAFVGGYNALTQDYVTWFATVALPVYTGPMIIGALLDWVALGLYGIARPSLASGLNRNIGQFNTYQFNTLDFNGRKVVGPQNVTAVTDDIFKRIITWNFYKGDGNIFNIRWLKRRIMRFLLGTNGTAPNVPNTDQVSVSFGLNGQVNIILLTGVRTWAGGMRFNGFRIGAATPFDDVDTNYMPLIPLPNMAIFKEAVDSGALKLPFQFTYVVII